MESEKTGVELLLSEPEIVAWLGLDNTRPEPSKDWRVGRSGEVRPPVPTAPASRSRMFL
jgi:hypothetical protein